MILFCLNFSKTEIKDSNLEVLWRKLIEKPSSDPGFLFYEIQKSKSIKKDHVYKVELKLKSNNEIVTTLLKSIILKSKASQVNKLVQNTVKISLGKCSSSLLDHLLTDYHQDLIHSLKRDRDLKKKQSDS
jgi:hypothetical protein